MNSMVPIVGILIVIVVGVFAFIRNYYYSSVHQAIQTRLDIFVNGVKYEESVELNYEWLHQQVESFSDKDKMEVMALTEDLTVEVTSNGLASDYPVPEFQSAMENTTPQFSIGKLDDGESYMSATVQVQDSGDIVAMRIIVSLDDIDRQVLIIGASAWAIAFVIFILVTYSGFYFSRSIVVPVSQVSASARKIAMGDFSARLDVKNNDEIGELCETINYMAEELSQTDRLKNEFISSVSHELRTPLTAIRGWAETLSMAPVEDRKTLEKGMRVILNETERLGNMVEELLDFSRMQNGRFSLIKEKMDVLAELEETAMIFSERANREGIRLVVDEPEFIAPVLGDHNRLKQAFINLLDNAFKYTPSGGTVRLSVEESDNHEAVTIRIADSGEGISKEDLPNVKTRFYKGTGARRGSGIGLSVVDEIISRHGGSFDIDSVKGEGTTATIVLPTIKSNGN